MADTPDQSPTPAQRVIPDSYVLGLLVKCYEPTDDEHVEVAIHGTLKSNAINWLASSGLIEKKDVPRGGKTIGIWVCTQKGKFLVDSMLCMPMPATYMAIPAQPVRTSDPIA